MENKRFTVIEKENVPAQAKVLQDLIDAQPENIQKVLRVASNNHYVEYTIIDITDKDEHSVLEMVEKAIISSNLVIDGLSENLRQRKGEIVESEISLEVGSIDLIVPDDIMESIEYYM